MGLTLRQHPALAEKPVALLGPDERIWATSNIARDSGVCIQMSQRQAQMRCPDVVLHPADLQACRSEQAALLATLARWQLPIEPLGWGLAYVDLHSVALSADDVRLLAPELGRNIQQTLGQALTPSIGWDSGKFTARAAALVARPGHIRLVEKAGEKSFLSGLPITMLPLPVQSLQSLHWLGIRTLGQFAGLPTTAVLQRFGAAGQTAQRWARGKDDRPVVNGTVDRPTVIDIDIDPPSGLLAPMVESVMAGVGPLLVEAEARLQGWRRLHLELVCVDGQQPHTELFFMQATTDQAKIRAGLIARLQALNWPSEASSVSVTILEATDLPIQQMALFPELTEEAASPEKPASELVGKYGPVFFRSRLTHAGHPVAARRCQLQPAP